MIDIKDIKLKGKRNFSSSGSNLPKTTAAAANLTTDIKGTKEKGGVNLHCKSRHNYPSIHLSNNSFMREEGRYISTSLFINYLCSYLPCIILFNCCLQ